MRKSLWVACAVIACVSRGSLPCEAGPLDRAAASVFAAERTARLDPAGWTSVSGSETTAPFVSPAKSGRRAFFLSLLLPGLGQRYLGQERRSLLYFGTEAGVWTAVTSFWLQGSLREDRYREYAGITAGADPNVEDDDYYRDVALYGSSDVFATAIRWEARALYPDDLDAQRRYYEKNIYPADLSWSWPDEGAFDEYQRLRRRSKRAYRTAVNCVGLAVLNRFVSAIDTVTGAELDRTASGVVPQFTVKVLPGDDGPTPFLELGRSF